MAEFKFFCPQCGQQVQCDTGYSGTQINCPACKQVVVVPQAPGSAAQPPVPAKSRVLRNVLVIAAAVIVLAGLVTAGWFGYSKLKRGHLPPGLVSLWSGEGNGSDSVDGNKAVLTDISFEEGKVGRAFSFNGTTSTITIPASPSLDIGADAGFTIMAWIKPLDVNGLHPIAEWSDNDCPLNLWIGVRPSENGVLRGDIVEPEGNHFVVSQPGTLVSDVFQHIAFTYDKASGEGTLYLNGVIVSQRQLGRNLVAHTKGDLRISHRDENPGSWSTGRAFEGLVDELAIYKRALSPSEIKTICEDQNHGDPLTLPAPSTGWFESWMR
jgi:hypothetical protein